MVSTRRTPQAGAKRYTILPESPHSPGVWLLARATRERVLQRVPRSTAVRNPNRGLTRTGPASTKVRCFRTHWMARDRATMFKTP